MFTMIVGQINRADCTVPVNNVVGMEANRSTINTREMNEAPPTIPVSAPASYAENRLSFTTITAAINERKIAVAKICVLTKWAVYKMDHLDGRVTEQSTGRMIVERKYRGN